VKGDIAFFLPHKTKKEPLRGVFPLWGEKYPQNFWRKKKGGKPKKG